MDEDYYCFREAKKLFQYFNDEVFIFKALKDKTELTRFFIDWWDSASYVNNPHSIFSLYECRQKLLQTDVKQFCDIQDFYNYMAGQYALTVKNCPAGDNFIAG